MAKKWAEPCGLCKGKSRTPCMMCGWSIKKRTFFPIKDKLTKEEIRERDALREKIDFHETLLMGMWKFSQTSVQSVDADGKPIVPSATAKAIDQSVLDHLAWVNEKVIGPYKRGQSISGLAERTGLTEKQIRWLIQNDLKRETVPLRVQGA